MKVLFNCWEYPPNGAGIGRYVQEMSSAIRGQGHETVVLTSRVEGLPEREELDGGVILRMFDRSELRSERVAGLAVDLAREHGAAWIEGVDHWGECATLLRIKKRPPVVIKMHYNDALRVPRYAQAWYAWQRLTIKLACLRQWRSIQAERYCIENADVLLAPCARILDEVRRDGMSLPLQHAVIPNPIRPTKDFGGTESAVPTLLLVGRLDVGKGLPYLPALIRSLMREFPELKLQIAGGDSYARGLGSTRMWFEKQLGDTAKNIELLGVLSQAELDEAYKRAWVVIVPSRWDTFPQVVLEAMVRGKAIVASGNGGMSEMLSGTQCRIEDPGTPGFAQAVSGFLNDRESRLNAGLSGRSKALSEFSPSAIAVKYLDEVSSWL